ncbi:MAG: glutamate racemase [Clostridiales Family XIII bacterium]|jgi:glutamate racemase|nr:glutamate racemase [Clostridiales Family XIII bacterium]
MMDNRPIGFFDSGLGGLTCIPHLMRALPDERIVYFGDTARTPYGSKAESTIRNFSFEISDFLVSQDVKMIAIACNTVSSIALSALRKRHPSIPILGIISPASHTIANTCTGENNVGIIGTKVTIASDAYPDKILKFNSDLHLHQMACPTLVPLIEEGIIEHSIMDLSIEYYLDHFIKYNEIDTLVLGCTHYPLIRKNIEKIYPKLRIVDPSKEMFTSIDDTLTERGIKAASPTISNIFYASDLSENFVNMINKIFSDSDFKVAFRNFDLDDYLR